MEVLGRLLEMSIYAAVLFLAITAVKMISRDKMSPALHYIIWFLPVARLCVPVTIDSGLRLIVIPGAAFEAVHARADSAVFGQIAALKWADLLIIVWLCGILLTAGRMLAAMARMNRAIKKDAIQPPPCLRELLGKCQKELGINKDIPLYILPGVTTPALAVGFRARVILPEDVLERLSPQQLEFAVKHELMHCKRRDHIAMLLLRILEIVHWFNPVVRLMARHMSLDMETACDSMVVKNLDKLQKKSYAFTLLQLSSQRRIPKFTLGLVPGNAEKAAEKRIRGIFLKYRSRRGAKVSAGVIAAVLFVFCFTTLCLPAAGNETGDDKNKQVYSVEAKAYLPAASEGPADPDNGGDGVGGSAAVLQAGTAKTLGDLYTPVPRVKAVFTKVEPPEHPFPGSYTAKIKVEFIPITD
jgi:beta-lactamase regulating signal transducer with metallopeptidase domain